MKTTDARNNRAPHEIKVWVELYRSPTVHIYFGECSCGFSVCGRDLRGIDSATRLHRAYEETKGE